MLRRVVRDHPRLVAAFALATLVALFFLVRLTVGALVWQSRAGDPVQPWMTVGYVAHSRGLSPPELAAAAQLPVPQRGHPVTLEEIAAERGVPVAEVIAQLEAAADALVSAREAAGPGGTAASGDAAAGGTADK